MGKRVKGKEVKGKETKYIFFVREIQKKFI